MKEKNNHKVGIIILNFNRPADTIECIESLVKISFENYLIILIDNGSTDNSVNLFENRLPQYKKVVLLKYPENLGFSEGNNRGINYAKENQCDYFLLLNNDTIVSNDFLEPLMVTMKKFNNNCILTPKILFHSKPDYIWFAGGKASFFRVSKPLLYMQKDTGIQTENEQITFISGCSMFLSLTIIEKIGFLDKDLFLYYEDLDYSLRALKQNILLYYVPKSKVYHKKPFSLYDETSYFSRRISTRNLLYIYLKNYSPVLFILFYFYFLFILGPYKCLLFMKNFNFNQVIALWEGFLLFHFFALKRKNR